MLVNHFETLVAQHMGLPLADLHLRRSSAAKAWPSNTTATSTACDHYVYPEYRLGQHPRRPLGDMVFSRGPGEIRLREERDPAGIVPPMPVPWRLLGRMPEEPDPPHAGRRAGAELSLHGVQAVLCARGAGGEQDRGAAARARRRRPLTRREGACRKSRNGIKAHGSLFPGEAIGIALLLGYLPYLLIRGPAARCARRQ